MAKYVNEKAYLARNDVNRVCDPLTTRVDKLMVVQKVC
jgi:anthranilate/para-aminobenzoate synthase component I